MHLNNFFFVHRRLFKERFFEVIPVQKGKKRTNFKNKLFFAATASLQQMSFERVSLSLYLSPSHSDSAWFRYRILETTNVIGAQTFAVEIYSRICVSLNKQQKNSYWKVAAND